MTRIDVDLNTHVQGMVRISRSRADADFKVGDVVEIVDESDPGSSFQAIVTAVDDAGRGSAQIAWADRDPFTWVEVGRWVVLEDALNVRVESALQNDKAIPLVAWEPVREQVEPISEPASA